MRSSQKWYRLVNDPKYGTGYSEKSSVLEVFRISYFVFRISYRFLTAEDVPCPLSITQLMTAQANTEQRTNRQPQFTQSDDIVLDVRVKNI